MGWCAAGSGRRLLADAAARRGAGNLARSRAAAWLGERAGRAGFFLGRRESRARLGARGSFFRQSSVPVTMRQCQRGRGLLRCPLFSRRVADLLLHRMQIWYRDNGFGVQNWHQILAVEIRVLNLSKKSPKYQRMFAWPWKILSTAC